MENKANGKAASRIERSVCENPKPKSIKVKTGIKAGPHIIYATGGD